jgi:hypothetical protein
MGNETAHNKQSGSNKSLPVKKKKKSPFFTLSGPPPLIKPLALPSSPVHNLFTSDAPDDGSICNMFDH